VRCFALSRKMKKSKRWSKRHTMWRRCTRETSE
jgi:hypothetical protein